MFAKTHWASWTSLQAVDSYILSVKPQKGLHYCEWYSITCFPLVTTLQRYLEPQYFDF